MKLNYINQFQREAEGEGSGSTPTIEQRLQAILDIVNQETIDDPGQAIFDIETLAHWSLSSVKALRAQITELENNAKEVAEKAYPKEIDY